MADYLDLTQLSKRLSLSRRTLRAWAKDPTLRLPAYCVNGKLLFRWSEVVRWLEQFRIEPVGVDELADRIVAKVKGSR